MSTSIERQLDDYGVYLQTAVDDLVVPEIAVRAGGTGDGPRRRRGWVVAVAAFAASLLLIGGLTLMLARLGGSDSVGDTDEPATTVATAEGPSSTTSSTVSATTVAPPATTAGPTTTTVPLLPKELEIGWQQVPVAAFEGGWISAMTEGGPGLVAVGGSRLGLGTNEAGEAHHGAGVWVSADGVDWEHIEDDVFQGQTEEGIESAYMSDITVGPNGLVAVGFDGRPQASSTRAISTIPTTELSSSPSRRSTPRDSPRARLRSRSR